jgi:hypothetical protein
MVIFAKGWDSGREILCEFLEAPTDWRVDSPRTSVCVGWSVRAGEHVITTVRGVVALSYLGVNGNDAPRTSHTLPHRLGMLWLRAYITASVSDEDQAPCKVASWSLISKQSQHSKGNYKFVSRFCI